MCKNTSLLLKLKGKIWGFVRTETRTVRSTGKSREMADSKGVVRSLGQKKPAKAGGCIIDDD